MRVLIITIALLSFVGCKAPQIEGRDGVVRYEYSNEIFNHGRKANVMGLEPNANPYIGRQSVGRIWLDGWMFQEEEE